MESVSQVTYRITPVSLTGHRFAVTCSLDSPDPRGQHFSMAAWIPGSYMIRDFARHVLSIKASSAGSEVPVTQLDKQTWRCAPVAGPLTVSCEIYALDSSVRAAYLDNRRGFFNGTSMFLRAHGQERQPCCLHIEPPPGKDGDWSVTTSLPARNTDAHGYGEYVAADYAQLIDHPVVLGEVSGVDFLAAGIPHRFAWIGRAECDTERLAADLARVCETHATLFGELPVERYLFLTQIAAEGYGGLEHADSCALVAPRHALPAPGSDQPDEAYTELLGLCSHEYFHLWNVKRIQPQGVAQSDLSAEAHFADLWAYEGVTSYYDELALVRAGLITPAAYLKRVARVATRLARTPGRHQQTLAESSFDAWTKFYRQDENAPNAIVSYYGKGALFSLCLDLTLRLESHGRMSLDTVMREAWQRFGAANEPVPDGGLEALVCDLSEWPAQAFFDRYLRGTEELPLARVLAAFGVRAEQQPANDPESILISLGVRLAASGTRLQNVLADSPAQRAGLCPGDRLLAIDGLEVDAENLVKRVQRLPENSEVAVHFFRSDELLQTRVKRPVTTAAQWQLERVQDVAPSIRARRDDWLAGPPSAMAASHRASG